MTPWQCVVAVLLALPAIGVTFSFPEEGPGPCGVDRRCVKSTDCPAYDGVPAAQRRRSNICGFVGFQPRVCCDTKSATAALLSTPAPLVTSAPEDAPLLPPQRPPGEPTSATHPALPVECGKPSRVRLSISKYLNGTYSYEYNMIYLVNGRKADSSKWPWMVLFGRWEDGRLGHWFCGGTLITNRHVLTAAHCFCPGKAGAVGARTGDARLSGDIPYSGEEHERNVSRITCHPHHHDKLNDLAVVQLAEPVKTTHYTHPICLPPAGAEHVGENVTVAGRGLTEFSGEPANELEEAPLRVTDPAACEAAYRRVLQFQSSFSGGFQGTVMCAASRDNVPRDACRGDSGGPLTIELPASSFVTYQLVGVVSLGFGCGNPDYPGLYTKVSAFTNWITQQLT